MPRVATLILALALACATACARPPPPAQATPPPEVVMERVTLVHTQGSAATVEATAPRVELSRSTGGLTAFDAGVHLLSKDAWVFAGRLEGSLDQGHLEGLCGVTLKTAQGTTGQSPRVTFERQAGAQGAASSDAGVHVEGDGYQLDAVGFSADLGDEHVVFERPVTRVDRPLTRAR